MPSDNQELVITLDSKQIVGIGVLGLLVAFSLYGYIVALMAFVAESGSIPLHINSVATADTEGNAKSSFSRGSLVAINVAIEHGSSYYYHLPYYYSYYNFTGETEYLLLIQVTKGGTPVFLGFVNQPILPSGIQNIGVGYRILESAPTGTYTVNVYVWSDWLPSGTILADNSGQQVTFTVTS